MKNRRLFYFNLTILSIATIYFIATRNVESNDISGLTIILLLIAFPIITFINAIVDKLLNKIIPWRSFKTQRFFAQILLGLLVSLLTLNGLYIILKQVYTNESPQIEQIILLNLFGVAIIIPIITIILGIKLVKEWNNSQIVTERLQKENARSQMMSLRNHLDPHFLFNNLNILSSLIDHDVELSKNYLDKFAQVYRTILKSELSDLITLSEELDLVKAYNYLIHIRWQEAVKINMNIPHLFLEKAIPPLALQMLIENVIKHNTISRTQPIIIDIGISNAGNLFVNNTKKIKKYIEKKREGTGLNNIQERYAYFTDKKVVIEDSEHTFSVHLPLLDIES